MLQRILIGFCLLISCGAMAAAEAPLTGDEIVARATEAAGGAAWKRPKTLYLQGDMKTYRGGDYDKALHIDDYRMWRAFPSVSENAHLANGKARFDAKADGEIVFQISFDGENTYNQNGLVPDAEATRQWAAAFGFGIIRFADGEGFSVKRLADDQVEGHDSYFVEVTDPAGETTIFGIDKEDYAIRLVGFDTPKGWHHRVYSDFAWAEEPKFRQPQRVRLYYNGRKENDINWPVFKVNEPIPEGWFAIDGKAAAQN